MSTRREIALGFLMAPLFVLGFLACLVWMVLAMLLVVMPVMFVVLLPAELLWFASPFVGLVSPRAGGWLASWVEPAADLLGNTFDWVMGPLDFVADLIAL